MSVSRLIPAFARGFVVCATLGAQVAAQSAAPESVPRTDEPKPKIFKESVAVERVVVDAHVVDRLSNPILGLGPSDFLVEVDGATVPLESVEWVGTRDSTAKQTDAQGAVGDTKPPEGRRIVMLFHWELAAQKAVGFIRMLRQAIDLVTRLEPNDQVAVLLFDSRLWLRQDFTTDHPRLEGVLRAILRHEEDRGVADPEGNGIAATLDEPFARKVVSIEQALAAIGLSLEGIPGKKSLLLFGSLVGNWYGRLTPNYERARRALATSETAVFAIDVSDGSHRLAATMQRLADDTGGRYVQTFDFPRLAMQMVERSISGHYVLVFAKPPGFRGEHRISVSLIGRKGTVLHRRYYEDGGR